MLISSSYHAALENQRMSPKKRPFFEKEKIHLPTSMFQGQTVSFLVNNLVGGFNPSEKYARQFGSFPT